MHIVEAKQRVFHLLFQLTYFLTKCRFKILDEHVLLFSNTVAIAWQGFESANSAEKRRCSLRFFSAFVLSQM